jgi:hypothetical protein
VLSPNAPARSVAIALLAAATLAIAGDAAGPVVYDPDPSPKGAGHLTGETWGKIGPTAAIRLTRIDDTTRTNYIVRRTGLERDPFMTSPEHATGFFSFHVLVENLSETRMVFQPQNCRLTTSWKDSSAPIDLPAIWTAYEINNRPLPKGLEKIRAALIDGELVLGPGEKRDGLLVYKAIDPQTKKYQIDISATLTDGQAFAFTAFYKKRKP